MTQRNISGLVAGEIEVPTLTKSGLAPEFLRLPPSGQKCAYTGLSRSALNELILPAPHNEFKPAVKSFVLRRRGARTGIRLVDYSDLVSYIRRHLEVGGQPSINKL